MKRKNLIVRKKAKKETKVSNLKIKKIYKRFKSIVFRKIRNDNFALAVSGGSDSLSLACLGTIYSAEFKNKMHILIVDHKIREESKKEAAEVRKILKKKRIKSKVLSWKGKIPTSNIQKNARNIRYSLISNYCKKNSIKFLITAHHMDDQIENFFIRLFRGSGLTGLSSMSESSDYDNKLKIIRPLLSFKKKDLQYITLSYFKNYIEDPSNVDNKYLRVRIRKFRNEMLKEGLSSDKIIKTIDNLNSANKALKFYKNKALYKHVSFLSKSRCLINKKLFSEEAGEIVFKSFSDILSLVSGKYYPPRSKKIINLIKQVKKNNFFKSTLGGCVIESKQGFIIISKEQKVGKVAYQPKKLEY